MSDRHKVVVSHGADVCGSERDECRGPAGRGHELDLQAVWLIELNDSAEIAAPEAVIKQVTI